MENKRKIVISTGIASIIAVVTTAMITMSLSPQVMTSSTHAQIAPIDVQYATELSDTITIGRITDIRTEKWSSPEYPFVTISTLEVERYLYNPQETTTLEIRDFGEGIYDDPALGKTEFTADAKTDLQEDEVVLLFLDYDKGNVLGDGYYIVGADHGKYTVKDDGGAENADSRKNTTVEEIEKTISETLAREEG